MYRWFFLDDGAMSGAENMATDELLLQKAQQADGICVLRIYSFDPPAVTIGYHQNPEKVLDIAAVKRDGIGLVRRVTGGRALLHDGELTYCIAAPNNSGPFGRELKGAYMKISEALSGALRSLGVDASISGGSSFSQDVGLSPPCIVSAGRHEITAGGRKIVCSAQRRTGLAFLQHGSILLGSASQKIVRYLGGDWGPLGGRVTSVSEEIGRELDEREVRAALIDAFTALFGIEGEPLILSHDDREEIARKVYEKGSEFSQISGVEAAGL
ncbi:MAG: lipoate--protein ligase family protein [Candidatus Krumholzibacteria bacterium]|nr:lipoate--protein ligase family protein [Candidatus Krumholzibacteria bacterium]